jgi:hypothetical protein
LFVCFLSQSTRSRLCFVPGGAEQLRQFYSHEMVLCVCLFKICLIVCLLSQSTQLCIYSFCLASWNRRRRQHGDVSLFIIATLFCLLFDQWQRSISYHYFILVLRFLRGLIVCLLSQSTQLQFCVGSFCLASRRTIEATTVLVP